MSKMARAISYVRSTEGGLVDHPDDPGGVTNFGISLRYAASVGDIDGDGYDEFDFNLDGAVTATDIRQMTPDQADRHYERLYFKWRIDEIAEPAIAIKIYDYHFPVGPSGAGRIVQRALRACGLSLKEDGVMGSKTIAAVNSTKPAYLMIALMCEGAGYFRALKSRSFEAGWLNRAYQLPLMELPND